MCSSLINVEFTLDSESLYNSSEDLSTQRQALHCIGTLVTEDRVAYSVFRSLHAPKLIEGIRDRELKAYDTDSVLFIPHCRKALMCLSTHEVNSIEQHYDGYDPGTLAYLLKQYAPHIRYVKLQ